VNGSDASDSIVAREMLKVHSAYCLSLRILAVKSPKAMHISMSDPDNNVFYSEGNKLCRSAYYANTGS